MPIPAARLRRPVRLRLPRRTARLRLTALYGAAFLACGACGATVLGITYLLYGHVTLPRVNEPTVQVRPTHVSHLPSTPEYSGFYEVLRIRSSAVKREGPYDVLKIPAGLQIPIATAKDSLASPGHRGAAISVADLGQITLDRQQMLVVSVIGLAVFLLAAGAIGWLLAGRVLRPLSTITAAARRISASSLHERLALPGPRDELKELADTLDSLFARLEASFEAQRRFAASASHELRTPLTRERTLLQVTLADPASTTSTWEAVSRELLASNAEQERLIEALLTLASSEAGSGQREPVDLAAVTSEALAAAGPGISRLGLNVQASTRPAAFDGDPLLVQQLVANLIDNAVRHNVPGGDVQVATGTSAAGVVLSVISSGPVIPAAEVDRLFQPFQRLGPRPARRDGGHGLGLSIVRAIAMAHGANVTAQPRPGGGLAIEVRFPRQPPHHPGRMPGAWPWRRAGSRERELRDCLPQMDGVRGRTLPYSVAVG
jgi:signal transduction histidine kinase